jgi:hypothetical protein
MRRIIFVVTIAVVLLTACSDKKSVLANQILGTWKNTSGYTIQFKDGGTGFIPGVAGQIPDTTFSYAVTDESHIQMNVQGQVVNIQVTINGDQLTWTDELGVVSYTRVK